MSSNFRLAMPIQKSYSVTQEDGTEKMFISGIASGPVLDHQNDIMADSALAAMQDAIKKGVTLEDGRWSYLPLRSSHGKRWEDVIGWIVEAELDAEKNLWITAELDDASATATTLYRKLNRGDQPGKPLELGLSIGGKVTDFDREWNAEKGLFARIIKGITLEETSIVGKPAYPPSFVDVIQKSLNSEAITTKEPSMESNDKATQDTTVNVVIPEDTFKSVNDVVARFDTLMSKYDELLVAKSQESEASETPEPTPTLEEIVGVQQEIVKSAVAEAMTVVRDEVFKPLVEEIKVLKQQVEEIAAQPNDRSIAINKEKGTDETQETPLDRYARLLKQKSNDPIGAAVHGAGISDVAKGIFRI